MSTSRIWRLVLIVSASSGGCSIHERNLDSTGEAGKPSKQPDIGGDSAPSNHQTGGSESRQSTTQGGKAQVHTSLVTGTMSANSSEPGSSAGGTTTMTSGFPTGGVLNSETAASSGGITLGGTISGGSTSVTTSSDSAGTSAGGGGTTSGGMTSGGTTAGGGGTTSGGMTSGGTTSGGTTLGGTTSGGTTSATTANVCHIGQGIVGNGSENPSNSCELCAVNSSSSRWTPRPNGWGCASGFCQLAKCTPGCWIEGTLVAPNAKFGGNACRACQPSMLDNGWSILPDGTSCDSGQICHAGSCEAACFISDAVVAANALSPTQACGTCAPGTDLTQWTRRSDCFRSLALGNLHSCARVDSGGVWCWGSNTKGQLGNNSVVSSTAPVPVWRLLATSIAVGAEHSCAIRSEDGSSEGGNVACWGSNQFGKLGANSEEPYSVAPLTVLNVTGSRALAAGYAHTCALLESRGIQCWGYNRYGQLGRGDNVDSPTAVAVTSINNATAIVAGYSHTCALLDTGTVECWGYNVSGQLGTSDRSHRNSPAEVRDLSQVQAISAGYSHTCALLEGGTVKCWGSNAAGELGDGTGEATRPTPVTVKDLKNVVEIAAGRAYTCARTNDGSVWCWGTNDVGQFGNGVNSATNPSNSNVPVKTNALVRARALSTGENHACAALVDAGIQCWGDDSSGQLGNGPATDINLPVDVEGF